jgi:hypothetical protein
MTHYPPGTRPLFSLGYTDGIVDSNFGHMFCNSPLSKRAFPDFADLKQLQPYS